MHSDSDTAGRLVELGVAALHEAGGRRGLIEGVHLIVGAPFAGPAVTVALPAGDNLGVHLALEAAEPGSVLCIASQGRGLYGVLGELLAEAGRARAVTGFVVDDGIRDLASLVAPPSVAARTITARGTQKRRLRQAVGSDVAMGGALVAAGDWVICDVDGVCVVAAERLEAVMAHALARAGSEANALHRLSDGVPSRELFGLEPDPAASVS